MRRTINQALLTIALAAFVSSPAHAYVEAPMTLGAVIAQSTVVCTMAVTKVDKAQSIIIYQKVADIKGKHPQETIKHILKQELRPGEIKALMEWAEPGKMAVFFHNGGASETCTGMNWYQAYAQGEWWGMSHGEPFLLRSFAGKSEKLPSIVSEIIAGKEALAPCMVDGNKDDLHKKTARIQRLKASLKLQDYNPEARLCRVGRRGHPPAGRHARLLAIRSPRQGGCSRAVGHMRRFRRRRQARRLPVEHVEGHAPAKPG